MSDILTKEDKRTNYCGALRASDTGKHVRLYGWVQRVRDLGSLIFIDLRDRTGIVQLAFGEKTDKAIFDKAFRTRGEYVVAAAGYVRPRGDGAVNKTIPTGEIEIEVDVYKILSEAETTPFEINDNISVRDELALKYRYLDLRRPSLQKNLILRHELAKYTREYFCANDFLEIETPMMIKPTPEGARDYIVPSRLRNGCCYALPQSPQLYKQLLMLAGFDRYFQLARCFRDEDLRADRQPEFTQIDLEMSFVNQRDLMDMLEGYVKYVFSKVLSKDLTGSFPVMTYSEAMNRYGSDKPDTRFGMEITDISDVVASSAFPVFTGALSSGGSVRGIVAKGAAASISRKELDRLTEHARGIGAKGLAYIRYNEDMPSCSFSKFLAPGELEAIMNRLGCVKGDAALIVADKDKVVLPVLGALRLMLGRQLGVIRDGYNFTWITEFPFFEWDEEAGEWVAMHHPFTMPLPECLPYLESDPASVRATSYDLVLNGVELLSGSMRITDFKLQQKMFEALGLTKEEIDAKFGFLVDAYRFGAPPHGGAALGLDRLAMMMCGADSLRDVVAFPKVQNASELMSGCPSPIEQKALDELGLSLREKLS